MPSVSKAQHAAVASGKIKLSPAKRAEWLKADKGRTKGLPRHVAKKK